MKENMCHKDEIEGVNVYLLQGTNVLRFGTYSFHIALPGVPTNLSLPRGHVATTVHSKVKWCSNSLHETNY